MPERGRLWIDGAEVVIGFRKSGAFSLYWDQDPVFQFDQDQCLRRVFIGSVRYAAHGARLMRLQQRQATSSQPTSRLKLDTVPLSEFDTAQILHRLSSCLQQIRKWLKSPLSSLAENEVVGAEPQAFRNRVTTWLDGLQDPIPIAESPNA
jgi:hypothetical protein